MVPFVLLLLKTQTGCLVALGVSLSVFSEDAPVAYKYLVHLSRKFGHLKILNSIILLRLMEQYIPDKNYSIHFVLFYNNLFYFLYFFDYLNILYSIILLLLIEQYITYKNYSIHFVLFYNNLIYFPYFFSQLYII